MTGLEGRRREGDIGRESRAAARFAKLLRAALAHRAARSVPLTTTVATATTPAARLGFASLRPALARARCARIRGLRVRLVVPSRAAPRLVALGLAALGLAAPTATAATATTLGRPFALLARPGLTLLFLTPGAVAPLLGGSSVGAPPFARRAGTEIAIALAPTLAAGPRAITARIALTTTLAAVTTTIAPRTALTRVAATAALTRVAAALTCVALTTTIAPRTALTRVAATAALARVGAALTRVARTTTIAPRTALTRVAATAALARVGAALTRVALTTTIAPRTALTRTALAPAVTASSGLTSTVAPATVLATPTITRPADRLDDDFALARTRPRLARRLAPPLLVLLGVGDLVEERAHVGRTVRALELTLQLQIGREPIALERRPELLAVGHAPGPRHAARQELPEIVHVSQQELPRVSVLRRLDRLGEIDDDRTLGVDQDVVLREIAVDDPGREHLHDLAQELIEVGARHVPVERELRETRRRLTAFVAHQLHDQHAVDEVVGRGHPDPVGVQSIDHVHFGRLPRLFLLGAAIAGAPVDGALVAGVADPPPFRVLRALLEGAMLRVLVDLGDPLMPVHLHEVDLGFFATLQRADHVVDHALIGERHENVGHAHRYVSVAMGRSAAGIHAGGRELCLARGRRSNKKADPGVERTKSARLNTPAPRAERPAARLPFAPPGAQAAARLLARSASASAAHHTTPMMECCGFTPRFVGNTLASMT